MLSRKPTAQFIRAEKKNLRNRLIKVSLLYLICLPVVALLLGFELLFSPAQTALATCTGAVNFSSPTSFSTAGAVNAVAVGDFNGDGKLDIVAANKAPSNTISLLLGNGKGGFSPASGSPFSAGIGNNPFALATGDFNNDGKIDLAVVNYDSASVSILLGNGAGGFSAASGSPVAVGGQPSAVAVADFNGDNKPDLVVTNLGSGTVSILLGNGAGGFSNASGSPFSAGGAAPSSVAVGDFNRDSKADIAVTNNNGVVVFAGNGSGGFSQTASMATGSSATGAVVADFNKDGKPDLAVANSGNNTLSVLLGNGSGGFSNASGSPFATGSQPTQLVVADFDSDGKPDLASSNKSGKNLSVLLGAGTGSFASAKNLSVYPAYPVSLATGDFNTDGQSDLVAANSSGSNVQVLLNTDLFGTLSKFEVSAPSTATASLPVNVTVTAKASCGNTLTTYRGTVTFTSSDAAAVLPADYTFVAADNGVHTFTNGVTFNTSGSQTLTVTDKAKSTAKGSATVTVAPPPVTNNTWGRATNLAPGVPLSEALFTAGSSRWYKFTAGPGSTVNISLTGASGPNLPANFDLNYYGNIQDSYNELTSTASPPNLKLTSAETDAKKNLSSGVFNSSFFNSSFFNSSFFNSSFFDSGLFNSSFFNSSFFNSSFFNFSQLSEKVLPPNYLGELLLADQIVPNGFQSQAYTGAQIKSLIGVSANDAFAPESLSRDTFAQGGTFYIQVSSRQGAASPTPYKLTVTITNNVCGSLPSVTGADPAPAAGAGTFKTVIVTDFDRLEGSASEKQTLQAKLAEFMGRAEIQPVAYINLSDANTQYARAQSARTIADNNLACPYAKNTYAGEIKKIIDSYRGTTSNLQYVVLIGPDNVIPFFRYPDAAGQGNERLYIPPVNPDGGLNAALQNGLLLSQDEYGSSIQITRNDYNFPLPNAAVGRLVQTAPEITRMLDLYIRANGNMNPQTALITGYDFAADGATAVEGQLQAAINQTTCDTASTSKCKAIITPQGTPPAQGWTADTLRTNFVNQRNDLVFLGGHFSAYDAQAADGQSFITAAEFAASPVDQTNTLVFSVGCHTGYNIPVADNVPLSSALLEPDWSQAFARKGVTAIIGTGYQYGDDQTIGYSERLYLEFSKQLRTRQTTGSGPVVTPIGQALVRAKKSYLDATKAVTGMDQKTVLEAALFGLPMMNVTLPGALNPTADPAAIGTPATVTANPGQNLQLATTELEVNPSLQTKTVQLQTAQNSPTVVPATYLSGADGVVTNPDEPVLPLERRNVNAANQILRGVGFRSGTYSDQPNIFPLISAPATEAGLVRPTFESSVFYPAQLWNINYYDALAGGNARLLVTPAQFKSSAPGASTGTLRSYSQLKLRLYYIPDVAGVNTTNTAALAAAPTIGTVQASRSGSNVTFSVKVTGDAMAGIQEVWVTYTANDGSWRSIDLAATPGDPMTWTATSNLSGVTLDNVRFMVQAANGTGLVTLATNAGNYYKIAPAIPLPAPKATKVTILAAPASTFFLDTPTFQAQLKDVNGVLLSGQAVSFDLGGQSVTATTDGSGIATVNGSFTTIQPVASYNLTALFKGTDSYLPSSDSRSLPVVQKSSVALAISPTTPTTVEYGSPTGIVATLTDSGENKPLGAKLVIFTGTRTDGKVFTKSVFTNFQGQAILQVPEWPSGVFSIKASFAGDSIHQSITSDSTGLTILPATIEVIPATNNQSANLNQPFAKQLQALVKNSHGVPIKGVIVTFTAPDSGPGGTFGYPGLNNIATAMTDNNGIATAPVFTANNIAGGPYIVAATVPGANNPANFSLTNLPPLAITSLDPSSTLAGGPAFTLTVNGVGFIDGVSKVRWDGAELPTTFVSSTQLKAQVAAALITTPKTVQITVANGTIISNALPFTVITASCERPTGLLTEYRVVGGAGVGSPDSTYTLANLVDQFNYTFWRWNNYPKAVAVQVTYPSPRIVTQIQLFTQNPTKAPLIYFQYLDSSGKWSDMPGLSAVTDAGSSYGLKTYSPTTPVTASQFRMVVDNVTYLSDISNFGDLLLCGASAGGGSPVSAPQPPVSHRLDVAAATGTGSTTANVLDGPPSTNWIVDGNPTTPVTLVLDLGSSRTVTGLSYFATGGTGDNSTKVEISDNPSFTGPNTFTLATGVNTGGYGAYGLKAIPLSQVKTGRYIRFTVTNTSGSWVVGGYGDVQVLGF